MKLLDAILLAVITAFLVMAVYHTVRYGIAYSYHLFMVVAFGLLWLNGRGVGKLPESSSKKSPNLPATPKQKKTKNK